MKTALQGSLTGDCAHTELIHGGWGQFEEDGTASKCRLKVWQTCIPRTR